MIKTILAIFLGLVLVSGGLGHFLAPESFIPFIPNVVPYREAIVDLSGGLEVILGIGVFSKISRPVAARLIMWLLILYTPLHIIDLMRADPAIGDRTMALIRLPLQGILIWVALQVSKLRFK